MSVNPKTSIHGPGVRLSRSAPQPSAEILAEPAGQLRPGVLGRGLVVGATLIAEEAVAGTRVDLVLERLAQTPHGLAHALHLVERDHPVRLAPQREHGRLDLLGLVERSPGLVAGDTPAVER